MHEHTANTHSIKETRWNKISFSILLFITVLSPIFFLPLKFLSLQFGTSLLFAFGVILAMFVYAASVLKNGTVELPGKTRYVWGFLSIVPIIYILSGVTNGFTRFLFFGYTLDNSTIGFILLSFVYMYLVSVLFRDKKRIIYSYLAFVLSTILFSIFLLLRIVFGAEFLSFGMFTELTNTMLGSWNNIGILFGVSLILSLLTLQMLKVNRVIKIVLSLVIILSLLFLALVNFVITWPLIMICSVLFILYSMFHSDIGILSKVTWKTRLIRIPVYPVLVIVISVVFMIWGASIGGYLATKLHVTNVEVRPSLSVTFDIAKHTLKSSPFFGSGPNTFLTQWLAYKPANVFPTIFWNTDFVTGIGLIPTFAITTGILGLLSWIIFFVFYLYLGVKSIFSKFDDSFIGYILVSSFFASLYLWVMTCVYAPSTPILILTFFFTGLFFASVYVSGMLSMKLIVFSSNPKKGFLVSFLMVALSVSGIFFGHELIRNVQSLRYFQKSSYALNSANDFSASENYMLKAISIVPNDVYYRSLVEIELAKLSGILAQNPDLTVAGEAQTQFNEGLTSAIKAGLAAKDADKSNYLNWVSLGRVYESVSDQKLQVQGAYNSASFAYTEALHRNPNNPGILLMLARLSANNSDLKQAETYALQSIKAKSNYLDAYFLLSQIEMADNNSAGAIDSVSAAAVIDPTNPAIFFQLGLLKYNTEDYDGAISALEHAIGLASDYANAKYFLGLAYEMKGRHEEAILLFENLKAGNPESSDVASILANLKAGKPVFTNATSSKPEQSKTLPLKENL